jgi:hypothetical protein
VWRDGKLEIHHRAVWQILVGPIPDGALLCHHCDNPQCANPAHLYVGDGKTNMRDMLDRGRHWTQVDPERAKRLGVEGGKQNDWAKGARNPKAKLSPDDARDIAASTKTNRALATAYGVHITTIQRIKRGAQWTS